jgi:hypothetical protein
MPLVSGRYKSPYSAASQKPRYPSEYSTAHEEADPEMRSGRYQYGGGVIPSGSQDAFRWNTAAALRSGYSYPQSLAAAATVQRQYGHARGGVVDPLHDIDPREVQSWERESGPLGSNPGGMHKAPDGSEYYVKAYSGVSGDDRTRNEKLTNELYKLAGVPVPDVKLTQWKGHTAIASPIIEGEKLDKFEPREYPHIKDLLEHYPADAWLANYDVAGTHHNNIIVDYNNHAHRIDAGGGLRYRAKGNLKQHFGDDATDELFNLGNGKHNEWAAKLYNDIDFGPNTSGYETALRIAHIPDDHIRTLTGLYGPESREKNDELADKLIARRDSIAKAYDIAPLR